MIKNSPQDLKKKINPLIYQDDPIFTLRISDLISSSDINEIMTLNFLS